MNAPNYVYCAIREDTLVSSTSLLKAGTVWYKDNGTVTMASSQTLVAIGKVIQGCFTIGVNKLVGDSNSFQGSALLILGGYSISPWKLNHLRATLPLLRRGLPSVIFTQNPARSRPQNR